MLSKKVRNPNGGAPERGIVNPLTTEIATFQALHPKLVEKHLGQYVIVRGVEVRAGFVAFSDALREATARFPDGRYMIQRVDAMDMSHLLAQEIENCPCCSGREASSTETSVRELGTDGKTFAVSIPFPPFGMPSPIGPRVPRTTRRQMEREARRAAKRARRA